MNKSRMSRRRLIKLAAASTLPLAVVGCSKTAQTLACPSAQSNQSLRTSLGYRELSDSGKQCVACSYFSVDRRNPNCGNCTLFQGAVSATGYCNSWSAAS